MRKNARQVENFNDEIIRDKYTTCVYTKNAPRVASLGTLGAPLRNISPVSRRKSVSHNRESLNVDASPSNVLDRRTTERDLAGRVFLQSPGQQETFALRDSAKLLCIIALQDTSATAGRQRAGKLLR